MDSQGFAVLYHWRVKPGCETQFAAAWSELTLVYRERFGALGSRLHQAEDGSWYAYAQWPSSKARSLAFSAGNQAGDAVQRMEQAIAESFPELRLQIVLDHLIQPGEFPR